VVTVALAALLEMLTAATVAQAARLVQAATLATSYLLAVTAAVLME